MVLRRVAELLREGVTPEKLALSMAPWRGPRCVSGVGDNYRPLRACGVSPAAELAVDPARKLRRVSGADSTIDSVLPAR